MVKIKLKKIKKFLLYVCKWEMSTPVIALTLWLLPIPSLLIKTIIANIIGAFIFFPIDNWIFGRKPKEKQEDSKSQTPDIPKTQQNIPMPPKPPKNIEKFSSGRVKEWKSNVKNFHVTCPKCHTGVLVHTGNSLSVIPPLYEYKCGICGFLIHKPKNPNE